MTSGKLIFVILFGALLFTGCGKTPLIPPMPPIKLNKQSTNHMSKEEIQSLLFKKMNQIVAEDGGSQYLKDPKHFAISVSGVHNGLADGKYVIWEQYSYSWVYGYYYDAEKSEIIEMPASSCMNSYFSGTSRSEHHRKDDCEEFPNTYYPGDDFIKKVMNFRTYLSLEFPNFIANYNSNK